MEIRVNGIIRIFVLRLMIFWFVMRMFVVVCMCMFVYIVWIIMELLVIDVSIIKVSGIIFNVLEVVDEVIVILVVKESIFLFE